MGYFILVEKDSKTMQKCWKWIIIGLLTVIAATCFTTSYAFDALQRNFNSNCISSAKIAFKRAAFTRAQANAQNNFNNVSSPLEQKVNGLWKEFNALYRSEAMNKTNGFATSEELYEYLNNGPSIFRTTTERTNLTNEEKQYLDSKDADFFKNYVIDDDYTLWGDSNACSYFIFVPIFVAIVAIVWIVFIFISGHRGEQVSRAFIHKSWRLVVPAIVCFMILAIISGAYAIVLNSRLSDFCNEFKSKFNHKALGCQLLMNRFSLSEDTAWSPATNFVLCKFFSWLTVALWLFACLVMLARCILGADFNFEEVENYVEAGDAEVDPETEMFNTKVKFNDKVRRYSHERVYKPTTEERTEEK